MAGLVLGGMIDGSSMTLDTTIGFSDASLKHSNKITRTKINRIYQFRSSRLQTTPMATISATSASSIGSLVTTKFSSGYFARSSSTIDWNGLFCPLLFNTCHFCSSFVQSLSRILTFDTANQFRPSLFYTFHFCSRFVQSLSRILTFEEANRFRPSLFNTFHFFFQYCSVFVKNFHF